MPFKCESCGSVSAKWMGFCPQCHAQEPLVETQPESRRRTGLKSQAARVQRLSEVGSEAADHVPIGIGELDRVLGGGLVGGSVVLVGGEPGVGKSTLLLQAAGAIASSGRSALLVSAEESAQQVAMRAQRLSVTSSDITLVADDDVDRVLAAAEADPPDLMVIDSIQTVGVPDAAGTPGGVSQIRESAARLIRFAKDRNVATVLVGHVTKEGGIAGPKLLEHMVDVVLYLEGDPDRGIRALRCLKNRFGATHMVGVFEMTSDGLVEVADPSKAFLSDWESTVPGTVAFPAVEGRRSVLVEIQALTSDTALPQARRSVRGVESSRVHQILAVLDRHAGISAAGQDVYVNVVGGWRVTEPGCDLPVALAIASSLLYIPLGSMAAWGEIGLAGEVRQVPFDTRRRQEAERVGLERIIAPSGRGSLRLASALIQAGLAGPVAGRT
ncbi:MAG TPA: DNA repair protein RadA [Acidimicrobiia bacterium]|nr:DNA repair protein RadA [Acidimicrobiia bacterium]